MGLESAWLATASPHIKTDSAHPPCGLAFRVLAMPILWWWEGKKANAFTLWSILKTNNSGVAIHILELMNFFIPQENISLLTCSNMKALFPLEIDINVKGKSSSLISDFLHFPTCLHGMCYLDRHF